MEDDFVGKMFGTPAGGVLKVIAKTDKKQGTNSLYLVECSICSNDRELFPELLVIKASLKNGSVPCGCSKTPRWSEEQQKIRLSRTANKRGFIFHGFAEEYKGNTTKIKIECHEHGVWETGTIANFINIGNGCPTCSGNERWTEEGAKEAIEKLGFKVHGFMSKTINKNTKVDAECNKGHRWQTGTITSFINIGNGCPTCSGNERWTEERAKEEIKKLGFKVHGFMSKNINANTKVDVECSKGHRWQTGTIDSFINQGNGCPTCANYGFDPDKPGYLYVVKWQFDGLIGTKYGITNREVETRVKEQQRTALDYGDPPVILKKYYFNMGADAQELERKIKKIFGGNFLTEDELPDGHTETIPYKRTEELIKFIEENI